MATTPNFFDVIKQQANQIAASRSGAVQPAQMNVNVPQMPVQAFSAPEQAPTAPAAPRPPRAGFTTESGVFVPGYTPGRDPERVPPPFQSGKFNIYQQLPDDYRKYFMGTLLRGYTGNRQGVNERSGRQLTKKQASAMGFAIRSILDPVRGRGLDFQGILDSIQGGTTLEKGNKKVSWIPLGQRSIENLYDSNYDIKDLLAKGYKPYGRSDKSQEQVIRELARLFANPKLAIEMEKKATALTREYDRLTGGSKTWAKGFTKKQIARQKAGKKVNDKNIQKGPYRTLEEEVAYLRALKKAQGSKKAKDKKKGKK